MKLKSIISLILIILAVTTMSACNNSEQDTGKKNQVDCEIAEKIMDLEPCQDGAIYNDFIFHFSKKGECIVYSLKDREKVSSFTLDKIDIIIPHANSVCFSSRFYDKDDEFPLIYVNVYNNYWNASDRREGQCCVYRIERNESDFLSTLLQIIKIEFVDNLELWKSLPDEGDVRPYGNFVVDADKNKLYSLVMRDRLKSTRFFEFDLPIINSGNFSQDNDIEILSLTENDIITQFDCSYFEFMQGCAYGNGKILSIEGFHSTDKAIPKLRIIDLLSQREIGAVDLTTVGLIYEPEFLDYYHGEIYFADITGSLYKLNISCVI